MIGESASAPAGVVNIIATENRGMNVEEIAQLAIDKIIYIGKDVPEPIRIQAEEYREKIRAVLIGYLTQAVKSDRLTLAGELEKQGHTDMANIVRSL